MDIANPSPCSLLCIPKSHLHLLLRMQEWAHATVGFQLASSWLSPPEFILYSSCNVFVLATSSRKVVILPVISVTYLVFYDQDVRPMHNPLQGGVLQETMLCLVSTYRPFRNGWRCQELRCRQPSSPGHRNTQASPPRLKGRETPCMHNKLAVLHKL